MPKKDYNLLLALLDHGWEVKEFNSHEVTLVPKGVTHAQVQSKPGRA